MESYITVAIAGSILGIVGLFIPSPKNPELQQDSAVVKDGAPFEPCLDQEEDLSSCQDQDQDHEHAQKILSPEGARSSIETPWSVVATVL